MANIRRLNKDSSNYFFHLLITIPFHFSVLDLCKKDNGSDPF